MTKKKKSTGKTALQIAIQEAKLRLPSERSKERCKGCFAPRNTLTVKGNHDFVWTIDQIELLERLPKTATQEKRSGINIPCAHCGNVRYLSMGSYGRDVLEADMLQFKLFTLLKDDKFNALIGINLKEDKTLDLTEVVKE